MDREKIKEEITKSIKAILATCVKEEVRLGKEAGLMIKFVLCAGGYTIREFDEFTDMRDLDKHLLSTTSGTTTSMDIIKRLLTASLMSTLVEGGMHDVSEIAATFNRNTGEVDMSEDTIGKTKGEC